MEGLTAVATRTKRALKVPDDLIWEVLDDKPLYRRGFMDVVRKLKNRADIMGTSSYQSIIITYLTKLLARQLDDNRFDYLINEIGVHLTHRDNISNDIAIFDRLRGDQFSKKYIDFAPKVVIEVDIDIDPTSMPDAEYLNLKTQKMLDFGVERVVWIFADGCPGRSREMAVPRPAARARGAPRGLRVGEGPTRGGPDSPHKL